MLWGEDLLNPLVVSAVVVLLVNDHLLKGSGLVPGVVTGKLSDVAGLFFFPILLVALAQGVYLASRGRLPKNKRRLAIWATVATGVGFALVNLWVRFNLFIERWWGGMTMDPTDLLTLPVLWLSYRFMISPKRRRPALASGPRLKWAQLLLAGGAGLASIATPAMDPCRQVKVRNYPVWQISEVAQTTRGCAEFNVWISRSGKEGLGLTLRARNLVEDSCELTFSSIQVHVAREGHEGQLTDHEIILLAGEEHHIYVPIFFPSESLWNAGEREGRLDMEFTVEGARKSWSLSMQHYYDGPYRTISACDDERRNYLRGIR